MEPRDLVAPGQFRASRREPRCDLLRVPVLQSDSAIIGPPGIVVLGAQRGGDDEVFRRCHYRDRRWLLLPVNPAASEQTRQRESDDDDEGCECGKTHDALHFGRVIAREKKTDDEECDGRRKELGHP